MSDPHTPTPLVSWPGYSFRRWLRSKYQNIISLKRPCLYLEVTASQWVLSSKKDSSYFLRSTCCSFPTRICKPKAVSFPRPVGVWVYGRTLSDQHPCGQPDTPHGVTRQLDYSLSFWNALGSKAASPPGKQEALLSARLEENWGLRSTKKNKRRIFLLHEPNGKNMSWLWAGRLVSDRPDWA